MDQIYWLAIVGYGFAMLMLWIWQQPADRVYFTAGTGAIAFLIAALTAPGVERVTETGERIAAGPGLTVQIFLGLLGLLSLTTIFLYRLDEYPPTEEYDR